MPPFALCTQVKSLKAVMSSKTRTSRKRSFIQCVSKPLRAFPFLNQQTNVEIRWRKVEKIKFSIERVFTAYEDKRSQFCICIHPSSSVMECRICQMVLFTLHLFSSTYVFADCSKIIQRQLSLDNVLSKCLCKS